MNLVLALFAGTVRALLSIVELCFLIRALLSWFPISDENPILLFVTMVTEPIVGPVRALINRMGWFQNIPIDISFIIAYLLLFLVDGVLILFA